MARLDGRWQRADDRGRRRMAVGLGFASRPSVVCPSPTALCPRHLPSAFWHRDLATFLVRPEWPLTPISGPTNMFRRAAPGRLGPWAAIRLPSLSPLQQELACNGARG